MKSKMICTTCTSSYAVARTVADYFNAKGYRTMIEAIPSGRRVKITRNNVVRTVTGLATCVDVDITTTEGGMLATYRPSLFKENAAAVILSVIVFWPVLVTEIIGWIQRSGLDREIFEQVERACITCAECSEAAL